MYRSLRAVETGRSKPDAVAIALFEKTSKLPGAYASIDRAAGGAVSAMLGRGEFSAGRGSLTTVYPAGGKGASRVFILGLGDRDKFTSEAVRVAAARLLRAAFSAKMRRVEAQLEAGVERRLSLEDLGRAIGDGAAIANFEFDAFKGSARGNGGTKSAAPAIGLDLIAQTAVRRGIEHGLRVGESVNLTRTLAATPPNIAHPGYLVDQARRMAKKVGLRCSIIDAAKAKSLGMGGLLAVGAAGSHPPALIVLEHKPARTRGKGPILLVGKAVTFDTGGYSIKPADGMDKMKYDKCGGMAVIGAMHAIASLKLPVHVVGLIPAAENMIAANAYRPGDIITFCNGVTSEITNTDAEGRLILADALAWGTRTYKPAAVVDLATLTGGVVVALGPYCAGCFCRDTKFRGHLFDASDHSGERLWHLPLWDEHRAQIKATHGDILNSAGRDAHPIQGAAFLSYFIEPDGKTRMPETPWAHLDIAGVADTKKDSPPYAVGPTGFGVRLLVRAIETWK
ncbi:MAG: leucyl aminopeptidase [Planctomycetes bacterium]|nr:leucyl aminopeptidase [Planctomycetota bacterium]